MGSTIRVLFSALAATGCASLSAWAQSDDAHGAGPVRLAQFIEPYEGPYYDRPRIESFIDEFGRRIIVDSAGNLIDVQEPRRVPRDREPIVLEGAPPPGLTLRGRLEEVPPDDRYVPFDEYGNPGAPIAPPSADPFYGGEIAREPLPAAREPREPVEARVPEPARQARTEDNLLEDPGEFSDDPLVSDESVPSIGDLVTGQPEGTTITETDPAPVVEGPTGKDARVQIAALQVILDRAGMSPGVIDGRMGSNVNKAMAAYEERYGRTIDATNSQALAEELDRTGGPAVITYTITNEDVEGPYIAMIPADYAEKAQLPELSFTSPLEMLAEKFHMDQDYLRQINPNADFSRPGTQIKVMNVGERAQGDVARIVADKGREQVRAYNAQGELLVAYPATIGSASTPSPSGTVHVNRIAFDPNYTYNPKINFKQGDNDKILTIPPGPNGPVGSIWIALSRPTYGIHGTPEPSKIGKTNSHGCVRLTNWDAFELAKMVEPGVTVEFVE